MEEVVIKKIMTGDAEKKLIEMEGAATHRQQQYIYIVGAQARMKKKKLQF